LKWITHCSCQKWSQNFLASNLLLTQILKTENITIRKPVPPITAEIIKLKKEITWNYLYNFGQKYRASVACGSDVNKSVFLTFFTTPTECSLLLLLKTNPFH
jgi:hypothetical protein